MVVVPKPEGEEDDLAAIPCFLGIQEALRTLSSPYPPQTPKEASNSSPGLTLPGKPQEAKQPCCLGFTPKLIFPWE